MVIVPSLLGMTLPTTWVMSTCSLVSKRAACSRAARALGLVLGRGMAGSLLFGGVVAEHVGAGVVVLVGDVAGERLRVARIVERRVRALGPHPGPGVAHHDVVGDPSEDVPLVKRSDPLDGEELVVDEPNLRAGSAEVKLSVTAVHFDTLVATPTGEAHRGHSLDASGGRPRPQSTQIIRMTFTLLLQLDCLLRKHIART